MVEVKHWDSIINSDMNWLTSDVELNLEGTILWVVLVDEDVLDSLWDLSECRC